MSSLKLLNQTKIITSEARSTLAFVNPEMNYFPDGMDLGWAIGGWFVVTGSWLYPGEDGGEAIVGDLTTPFFYVMQYIMLEAGKSYRISWLGKVKESDFPDDNTFIAVNDFEDFSQPLITHLHDIAQGGDGIVWKEYNVTFTTTHSSQHNFAMRFYHTGAASTIKFKHFIIEEI